MPIYEYGCAECGAEFEDLVAASASPPPCPECASARVERRFSGFGTKWKPSFINWHRVGSSWGNKPPKKNF